MTYYINLHTYFPSPDSEAGRQLARFLEPPFRAIGHISGIGALIEFGEDALPVLRDIFAGLGRSCWYIRDGKRRIYKVTATDIELLKERHKPGENRRVLRGLRRKAKWAASDTSLCENVSEPAVIPDGRVPFFWRYKRFACVKPGQERPFRYSLRSPKGKDRLPLVVYLHSAAGFGVNGVKAVVEIGLLPQLLLKKCRVLVPQTGLGDPYCDEVSEDLSEVIASLPGVDRSRVYLMGTSMGGCGAVIECRHHPERYAACASSVAWLQNLNASAESEYQHPLDEKAFDALARTPLWLGYGRDERCVNEPLYEALKKRGADVKRTYFKGFGHGLAGPVFWLTHGWSKWLFSHQK